MAERHLGVLMMQGITQKVRKDILEHRHKYDAMCGLTGKAGKVKLRGERTLEQRMKFQLERALGKMRQGIATPEDKDYALRHWDNL